MDRELKNGRYTFKKDKIKFISKNDLNKKEKKIEETFKKLDNKHEIFLRKRKEELEKKDFCFILINEKKIATEYITKIKEMETSEEYEILGKTRYLNLKKPNFYMIREGKTLPVHIFEENKYNQIQMGYVESDIDGSMYFHGKITHKFIEL